MKYESAASFRAALEQRLKTHSEKTGLSLVRLRKAIVFDRLLARLLASAPGAWVVKGALALDFRLGGVTRTTKDIDLVHRESLGGAEKALIAAQRIDADDFFEISVEKAGQLGEQAGGAIRYRARAELAGRLFDEVLVDLGVTEIMVEEPEIVSGIDLLEFADFAPLEVPTLPLEQHIAEKVHAYTRTYRDGLASSRAKDLVDLVLIAMYGSPKAQQLDSALNSVFDERDLQPLPDALPAPPSDWSLPYRKLAEEVGIDANLSEGHHRAGFMLDPVLTGKAEGSWNPQKRAWEVDSK